MMMMNRSNPILYGEDDVGSRRWIGAVFLASEQKGNLQALFFGETCLAVGVKSTVVKIRYTHGGWYFTLTAMSR